MILDLVFADVSTNDWECKDTVLALVVTSVICFSVCLCAIAVVL